MADLEKAKATQLHNIEIKTGQKLSALYDQIGASGKVSHGEVRTWVMEKFGLGYGDANALAHAVKAVTSETPTADDPLDAIYAGKKEHLRGIHDALIAAISLWGEFEQSPKKAYIALRRKKQFAMLGPKNLGSSELGINLKDEAASSRIIPQKPGGMCQYAVSLKNVDDIDEEILRVLRRAFDVAG